MLPALAFFYGIKPSEVEEMPYDEIEVFVDQIDDFLPLFGLVR